VICDELHLRAGMPCARATIVATTGDRATSLATPLLGKGLDQDTSVHVELDDVDVRSRPEQLFEPVVVARRSPGSDGSDQCGAHCVLVERHRDGVDPVAHSPDAPFEVDGLAR